MNLTTSNQTKPTFSITKNKGKLKIYNNSNVYLSNNDEFEIELFNPTTDNILAKIIIKNIKISTSGIVIKPGQRVFLERFLDSNNKFKFISYDVENNNELVNKAIQFNGLIEVEFYKKEIHINYGTTTTWLNGTGNNGFYNTYNNFPINCSVPLVGTLTNNISYDCFTTNSNEIKKTGTVEKGNVSEQVFTNDTDNYSMYCFHKDSIKILPIENKNIEADEIRCYCTSCGVRKRQDTWKFCPKCGNKF